MGPSHHQIYQSRYFSEDIVPESCIGIPAHRMEQKKGSVRDREGKFRDKMDNSKIQDLLSAKDLKYTWTSVNPAFAENRPHSEK